MFTLQKAADRDTCGRFVTSSHRMLKSDYNHGDIHNSVRNSHKERTGKQDKIDQCEE